MLDAVDKRILAIMGEDAKISNADLAKRIGMAPSGTLERVRKLEARGIVKRYETRVAPSTVGIDLTTFVLVKTTENVGSMAIGEQLAEFPCVQEVHFLAGEYCYLLKIRVRNVESHAAFLRKLGAIKGITSTQTTLVLETIKETIALDMAQISGEREP